MAALLNVFRSPESPTKLPKPREGWQSGGHGEAGDTAEPSLSLGTQRPGAGRPAQPLTGTYPGAGARGGAPTSAYSELHQVEAADPIPRQDGEGAPGLCSRQGFRETRRPRPTKLHTAEATHRVWEPGRQQPLLHPPYGPLGQCSV